MRKAIVVVIAITFLLLACSSPSTVNPISVPLQYKTMAKPLEFPALGPCGAVSSVEVVDSRAGKDIGKRYVEDKTSAAAPVTAANDVAAWVRSGVEEALRRSGVVVGKSGAPVLHITIEQIDTLENVLHRSGYEGRISLSAELRGPNGKSCWSERGDGFAENYGYAGSIENYQETLNHALDRTVIRLLASSELKKAICESCG